MNNEDIVYVDEKVSEKVYEGVWALDMPWLSEDEQKMRILEMMEKDTGIHVDNPDEYTIDYVGAEDHYNDDNNTYDSETQTSRYVVYRVTRERLEDDNLNNIDFEPIENDAQVGPMNL